MLWQIIFLTTGILSLIYYGVICIALKKWDSTFSRFWLLTGMAELAGYGLEKAEWIPQAAKGLLLVGAASFLITEWKIITGMKPEKQYMEKRKKKMNDETWIIVLGAQVRGRKITDSLKRRLDTALEYLRKYPQMRVVVSGGKGRGEDVTEAFAMSEYLELHGIEKKRILQETESVSTLENLKYSKKLLNGYKGPVGIVSNNFHVYRACLYAGRAGFTDAYPIAAGCHPLLFPNYMVRECMAVWKLWLKK